MPGLRLLVRSAPFILGVLAAAVWLRRAQVQRPLLEPPRERTGRFNREPIDIVTVVDDLLGVAP
jgi:hypothetical protein